MQTAETTFWNNLKTTVKTNFTKVGGNLAAAGLTVVGIIDLVNQLEELSNEIDDKYEFMKAAVEPIKQAIADYGVGTIGFVVGGALGLKFGGTWGSLLGGTALGLGMSMSAEKASMTRQIAGTIAMKIGDEIYNERAKSKPDGSQLTQPVQQPTQPAQTQPQKPTQPAKPQLASGGDTDTQALQIFLRDNINPNINPTGIMDRTSILALQQMLEVPQTGVIDQPTQQAINQFFQN